jgi:hypothetical protein
MTSHFVIEDESHAETISEHASLAEAWRALEHLATVPWDEEPNVAPCTSWRTCGRRYEIIEYDSAQKPHKELRRLVGLEISAEGTVWGAEAPANGA